MTRLSLKFSLQMEEKQRESKIMRPCDIPIYGPESEGGVAESRPRQPGRLEAGITDLRRTVMDALVPMKELEEGVAHVYNTGVAHTKETHAQLLDEENVALRAGFIAGGGLLGLMVGALRGRMLKKLFYTSLGAGGASAIVYPKEAVDIGNQLMDEGEKYAMIAYNFVVGVGPNNEEKSKEDSKVDLGQSNPADKDLYTTRDDNAKK